MTAYLTPTTFRDLTTMPNEHVSAIETMYSGWLAAQLEYWSRWIDAQLAKRYATPFALPYPITVTGWLARLVTHRAYLKRGIDPTDDAYVAVKEDAEAAAREIQEAANSSTGLYELPLIEGSASTGIERGGPFGYSEQSPYVAFDRQRATARTEDSNRGGSYG